MPKTRTTKICGKCKRELDLSCFSKYNSFKQKTVDGYQSRCKACNKQDSAKRRREHPDYYSNWCKANYIPVPRRKLSPETARERRNDRERERRVLDVDFKLRHNLRCRLLMALKNMQKTGSAISDLGCTIPELKRHLESLFEDGMHWFNHGSGKYKWSIDHIMPLYAFDLSDRQHFLLANHFLNLKPMWHPENLKKGRKKPNL